MYPRDLFGFSKNSDGWQLVLVLCFTLCRLCRCLGFEMTKKKPFSLKNLSVFLNDFYLLSLWATHKKNQREKRVELWSHDVCSIFIYRIKLRLKWILITCVCCVPYSFSILVLVKQNKSLNKKTKSALPCDSCKPIVDIYIMIDTETRK